MKLCWPGFKEKGTLIIPVDMSFLPISKSAVTVFGKVFEPKKELHITLIGSKLGKMLLHEPGFSTNLINVRKGSTILIEGQNVNGFFLGSSRSRSPTKVSGIPSTGR